MKTRVRRSVLMAMAMVLAATPTVPAAAAEDPIACPHLPPDFQIDFARLAPATTPAEAAAGFAERKRRVTEYNACRTQLVDRAGNPTFTDDDGDVNLDLDFTTIAIAKLEAGGRCVCQDKENIAQVTEALLRARVKRKSGTDFPFPCKRSGDYDAALRGLVAMLYIYGPNGQGKLDVRVYDHVLRNLLNQTGPHDPAVASVDFSAPCPIPSVPETENHILMIETSRYLTNQLLLREGDDARVDNRANGFSDWMLRYLQRFLKNDFDEYNSRPYQTYGILAVQNLHEFAQEPRVKTAAQMVLDYLSAKFAVSSNELRRPVPFRRLRERKDLSHLLAAKSDPQTQRFIMLSGVTQRLAEVFPPFNASFDGRDLMQLAAVGTYRVPDLILDLVTMRAHSSYFQTIKHDGVELYSSSPEFLIAAGGYWHPSVFGHDEMPFICYKDVGWALPTTLIPTGGGVDYAQFIRIDGDRTRNCIRPPVCDCFKEDHARINTCVADGFACGLNPVVPAEYAACSDKARPWTFIDGPRCNPGFQFYAAVYRKELEEPEGWGYGFFEAASAKGLSYPAFKAGVLARNGSDHHLPEDDPQGARGHREDRRTVEPLGAGARTRRPVIRARAARGRPLVRVVERPIALLEAHVALTSWQQGAAHRVADRA